MRNLNLDITKVYFTIAVITTHLFWLGFRNNYGYLAVEFFFFCTGYFMMDTIQKNKNKSVSSASFLKRKISIFFPMFLAAEVLAILFKSYTASVTTGITWEVFIHNCILSINELLFFQMANYPCYYGLGVGWYFSAMIIGLALLYPLAKRYSEALSGSSFFIGILLLGIVYTKVGQLGSPEIIINYVPCGLIRAIGDMCLGIFLFTCQQKIKDVHFTTLGRCGLGIIELLFVIVITWYIITSDDASLQYFIIMLIWGLTFIVISEKSILHINRECLTKYSSLLGKISLLLLLNHYWIFESVSLLFYKESSAVQLVYSLILIMLFSGLCYVLSILFIKAYEKLKSIMILEANYPNDE